MNNLIRALLFVSVSSILTITSCNNKTTLPIDVGTGISDITPPEGYPKYGYPRNPSTGMKDPLLAKAIVFQQGDTRCALLMCDLLGIPRDLSRIVREKASKITGIPFQNITIAATHTHTSPGITEDFKDYANREASGNLNVEDQGSYFTYLIEGMVKALSYAYNSKSVVEMVSGIGQAPGISFNRRYLMTGGRVLFMPVGLTDKIVRPAGPEDTNVHFVLFKPEDKTDFSASLTVFSSHYALGGTAFSADYPETLQKHLRKFLGEEVVSVFSAGACGNICTIDFLKKDQRRLPTDTEKVGSTLAGAIKNALGEAKLCKPALGVNSRTIYLPLQDYTEYELNWSKEGTEPLYPERDFLTMRRRLKLSVWGVQPPLEKMRRNEAVPPSFAGYSWHLPIEITAFSLDENTAVVTMPGELFIELGIDLKKRSPFSNTMLIELANADIAYVPTEQAFKEGDYEALNSRLQPGSGEEMIDCAIQMLEQLKVTIP
jgi:hypothetical protein